MADQRYPFSIVERVLVASMWWLFLLAIIIFIPFLRVWWWVFLPLMLSLELNRLYIWWINWDHAYANKKWVVLEIVPPKEILTPLKAMEDVFTVMWPALYSPPNFREKWCEGSPDDSISLEIASIEGMLHFYMRVSEGNRGGIESAFYAHYPQLEISAVPDYTQNIPSNLPNKEWDIYGEDYVLVKKAPYPIKTYEKFFEPQGEKISAEEKRIDPISSLLESMSKLGSGEQFWLQFVIMTMDEDDEANFRNEAKSVISKISKRPEKKDKKAYSEIVDALRTIVVGPIKVGEGDKASYKFSKPEKTEDGEREMVMTPGERDVLTEVENKLRKPVFRTVIRGFYVARRENFKSGNKILCRSYFSHFQTQNMNAMKFSVASRPKTKYFFRKKVPMQRSRRMLRNFVSRFTPFFPNTIRETAILSTEELTTLFHFPFKITGMAMPSTAAIQSKKSGAPPNLPM